MLKKTTEGRYRGSAVRWNSLLSKLIYSTGANYPWGTAGMEMLAILLSWKLGSEKEGVRLPSCLFSARRDDFISDLGHRECGKPANLFSFGFRWEEIGDILFIQMSKVILFQHSRCCALKAVKLIIFKDEWPQKGWGKFRSDETKLNNTVCKFPEEKIWIMDENACLLCLVHLVDKTLSRDTKQQNEKQIDQSDG